MHTQLVKLTPNNAHPKLSVTQDTQYVLDIAEGGYEVDLVFTTPGVTAELIGVYALKDTQSLNLTTRAIHKVPHTSCVTKLKGVLYDTSVSEYIGKIEIQKKAQHTSSFLEDNVLVLGIGTKNRSDPILEIHADDVKASHGATTGRINKDQIYYLQSRGLSKQEAEDFIVEGFFESLLTQIKDVAIRKEVQAKLR